MNNKLRVGIYLRLSSEDKDKESISDDSESIKNQRNMLIEYIEKHPDFALIDEYCDEDLSGAGTYRPEFERLINDCEKRKLDIVLCKSQSRFSRDMEIVEKYINNKFIEWNIRFISIADNADTLVLGNKKSRQINGLVNEWFLEDISNNIRSAFNSKMKQGEFISPFAAYGYEVSLEDNNKLVIDLPAALVVKKIYNLYLTGLGFTGIAKYLNDRKEPSPSLYKYKKGCKLNIISNKEREEIKWNANAIKTILSNELYIGNLVQGKRTTISYKNHKIINKNKLLWIRKENTHEKIIDNDTFNKVQLVMKERSKPLKKTGNFHLFSGKVFCFSCKHIMRKKDSKKYTYLSCYKCSNKSSIRYDALEEVILNSINKIIKKYYDIKELEKNMYDNKDNDKIILLEKQKRNLKNRLLNIKTYIKNLYIDKVNKSISKNNFEELLSNFNEDIEEVNKNISYINGEIDKYKINQNNKSNLKKYQHIDKLNKYIIDTFINKIYIKKNDKVKNIIIKWNI